MAATPCFFMPVVYSSPKRCDDRRAAILELLLSSCSAASLTRRQHDVQILAKAEMVQ